MKADIDRAVAAARAAAAFDWTWQPDDLARFCAVVDWRITELRDHGATIDTGLTVDRPEAEADIFTHPYTRIRSLKRTSAFVTDVADEDDPHRGTRTAAHLAPTRRRLAEELSAAGRPTPGVLTRLRWDLPKVVILLKADDRGVDLDIVNPDDDLWLGLPTRPRTSSSQKYSTTERTPSKASTRASAGRSRHAGTFRQRLQR